MSITQRAKDMGVEELVKENRKLKEENESIKEDLENAGNLLNVLEEENKKLRKECEENDYLVEDNARWMKKCEEKTMEIKKLKSDLANIQCEFGFESDEVGFWKGEYKRLKKWIKDHCKGYGNLFPEDEMKRQWKKADKKRK